MTVQKKGKATAKEKRDAVFTNFTKKKRGKARKRLPEALNREPKGLCRQEGWGRRNSKRFYKVLEGPCEKEELQGRGIKGDKGPSTTR